MCVFVLHLEQHEKKACRASQVSPVWATSGMGWDRDGMIVYTSLALDE